jgi:lipopolysaccharide export LptBFGC system permease protein LptF
MMRFVKILQRYVLKEILIPIVMSLLTLTFVLIIQMLFRRATELAGAVSLGLLFRFIWYILPASLALTLPMSILTGVLLGMGRMTVDSEVKAFRTHGVNLFSLFIPVLLLGLLTAGFSLFNSLQFAPSQINKSMNLLDQLKYELVNALEPGRFEDRLSSKGASVVLYFEEKDAETGLLKNVYLSIEGGPKEIRSEFKDSSGSDEPTKTLFLAREGRISLPFDPKKPVEGPERKAILELRDGAIHFLRDYDDPRYGILKFEKVNQEFQLSEDEQSRRELLPTLTLSRINDEIKRLSKDGVFHLQPDGSRRYNKDLQFLVSEKWQRVSISLACLSFVLIGLPLAIYIKPSGKSIGVAIAFGLIMAYYGVMHYGVVLTRQQSGWGPELGPYIILLPNVVLALVGGVLIHRTVHR